MKISPIERRSAARYACHAGFAGVLAFALVAFGILTVMAAFHEAHCSHDGPDCQINLVLMGKKAILVAPITFAAVPAPVPTYDGLAEHCSGGLSDPETLTPYRRGPPTL